jgi:hypothetical protein
VIHGCASPPGPDRSGTPALSGAGRRPLLLPEPGPPASLRPRRVSLSNGCRAAATGPGQAESRAGRRRGPARRINLVGMFIAAKAESFYLFTARASGD